MAGTPASSRGGSLPAQWTLGAGGQLEIAASDGTDETLFVTGFPGQIADVADFSGNDGGLSVQQDGTLNLNIGAGADSPGVYLGFAAAFLFDVLTVAQNFAPFATTLRFDQDGYLGIQLHAAPADGSLANGECMLWFDQTNGVGNTKLMLKGKSADGTVKTASIVLA